MMQFRHLELFCTDTEETKRFYTSALGFEIEEEQPGGFVWLISGGMSFLLRPNLSKVAAAATYQDAPQGLVIKTDDLTLARQNLAESGIAILGTDGSANNITFRDPDGRWIQLIQE